MKRLFIPLCLVFILGCRQVPSVNFSSGFDDFEIGTYASLKEEGAQWKAEKDSMWIVDWSAATKPNALLFPGGENRMVEWVPDKGVVQAFDLTFKARKLVAKGTYNFSVEVLQEGKWNIVFSGDDQIKTKFQTFQVPLNTSFDKVRFVSSAIEKSGTIIDDVKFTAAEKMALEKVEVGQNQTPVLIRSGGNPVFHVNVRTLGNINPKTFEGMTVNLEGSTSLYDMEEISLYYTGNEKEFKMTQPVGEGLKPDSTLTFSGNQLLTNGDNYFWISVKLKKKADLLSKIDGECLQVKIDGETITPEVIHDEGAKRIGVALRQHGDDGVHTYRIPGLATTNKGTLLAVYDNRYHSSGDLPGDIDVGMSRSTDGGKTWDSMKVIMDMGSDPKWNYDGIGDPSILVDRKNNTIWVAAAWCHGNNAWRGSGQGLKPEETGQFILVKSEDDGKTWSRPINITKQIKKADWHYLLQGPGKGITMKDGTLVFPAQFQDETDKRMPLSTIIYSKDHGKTWEIGTGAKTNTTEAQVIELEDGSLMLNMRDNRNRRDPGPTNGRAIFITKDLGKSWQKHATSRNALQESTCQASIIRERFLVNGTLKWITLFSNPNTKRGRHHTTIKASFDDGKTWPEKHQLLLDAGNNRGYSCMTKIDDETVGILYEGSQADMTFERVAIKEIIKE